MRKELLIIGLIVFLIDFFLIVSIFLFLKVLAIRPLEKLSTYAASLDINNLSEADFSLNRLGSNDELDNLVRSFNEMKHNLKKAHAELKDYAEN